MTRTLAYRLVSKNIQIMKYLFKQFGTDTSDGKRKYILNQVKDLIDDCIKTLDNIS